MIHDRLSIRKALGVVLHDFGLNNFVVEIYSGVVADSDKSFTHCLAFYYKVMSDID